MHLRCMSEIYIYIYIIDNQLWWIRNAWNPGSHTLPCNNMYVYIYIYIFTQRLYVYYLVHNPHYTKNKQRYTKVHTNIHIHTLHTYIFMCVCVCVCDEHISTKAIKYQYLILSMGCPMFVRWSIKLILCFISPLLFIFKQTIIFL